MFQKLSLSAGALLIGLSLAGSSLAQTTPFEGLYIGAQGHYSYIEADLSVSGVGSADEHLDGFGGSGFIGFGGSNGYIYGGIEADLGYDNADWEETSGGITAKLEAETSFGVSGRLGAVLAEKFLLYARAGWQRTRGKASVVGVGSDSEWIDGFRFGGGLEGLITDHFSARVEYTYTIYEDPTNIPGVDLDLNQHLVRVGASYYF